MLVTPWVGLALLVLVAWLAAGALRRLGVAGSAVLGGLAIGVLLGPTVLGRVAPDFFEDAFVGARPARESWRALERERAAWELATARAIATSPEPATAEQAIDPGPASIDRAARDAACADAERAWHDAAQDAQRPVRIAALLLAVATLAGVGAGRRLAAPPMDQPPQRAATLSIGLWAAGVPAAIALVLLFVQERPLADASALCLLAAVAVGPWRIEGVDRAAAENAELGGAALLDGARRVSTIGAAIALAAAAALAWHEAAATMNSAAPLAIAAIATLVGASWPWFARSPLRAAAPSRNVDDSRDLEASTPAPCTLAGDEPADRPIRAVAPASTRDVPLSRACARGFDVETLLVAPLAALAAVRIELFLDARWSSAIVLALVVGDGRWLGAFVGAILPGGRPPMRAARLVLGAAACAQTTIALCAVGLSTGLLPRDLGFGLLAGAAAVAGTAPLRRRVDERLRTGLQG